MNRIELSAVRAGIFECVSLHERERIARLRIDVNTYDLIESGAMVAHRCTASAAE